METTAWNILFMLSMMNGGKGNINTLLNLGLVSHHKNNPHTSVNIILCSFDITDNCYTCNMATM